MRILACSALAIAALGVVTLNSPVTARAAEGLSTSIYRCEIDGVMTFADRPCGGDAEPHRLGETVTVYEAPPITAPASKPPKSPAKARSAAKNDRAESRRAETCARFAQSLKEIRSKMRSGYTAKEGERLRERQAALRERQRAARCS